MPDPATRNDPAVILLVDDDPRNLLAAQAAFGDEGHELVLAHSGRQALRCLLERDFAVILLDVMMPDMDGFETARLIRGRARSRHTPIIFVTAYQHDDEKVLEGYGLGAVDFLFKPIVPEILRAKASVFVELHRRTERLRRLERKAHERRLVVERQHWEATALRAENARKDEFLAIVAHELRNPLTPIVLSLRLLRERTRDDDFAPFVDAMDRQVRHLTRLVDDLLDIGRITSGKITLQLSTSRLSTIVDQALETVGPLVAERAHRLTVIRPERDLPLVVDVDRLSQVICNLVSNAARYTDPSGHIEVAYGTDNGIAWVRVADDGRGISADVLPNVFDMFVQERENGKGLGLGLALVKKLVELHEGTVSAASRGVGSGSTFEFRLPIQTPAESPEPVEDVLPVPSNTRVLVVDDNDDVRYLTAELLRMHDLTVEVASDGISAVDLADRVSPEVILLDLGMPGTDGYATAELLRLRMGDRTPPIVAVSGFGSPSDLQRTAAAMFAGHLTKPVDPDVLLSTIARLTRPPEP